MFSLKIATQKHPLDLRKTRTVHYAFNVYFNAKKSLGTDLGDIFLKPFFGVQGSKYTNASRDDLMGNAVPYTTNYLKGKIRLLQVVDTVDIAYSLLSVFSFLQRLCCRII